mmetsp:Transcript_114971/g.330205  ORF Transcript_114971/g.330205 Transcript_114971/m.330205 type:complete len:258 (-) Transcript_114971:1049-1822(-)
MQWRRLERRNDQHRWGALRGGSPPAQVAVRQRRKVGVFPRPWQRMPMQHAGRRHQSVAQHPRCGCCAHRTLLWPCHRAVAALQVGRSSLRHMQSQCRSSSTARPWPRRPLSQRTLPRTGSCHRPCRSLWPRPACPQPLPRSSQRQRRRLQPMPPRRDRRPRLRRSATRRAVAERWRRSRCKTRCRSNSSQLRELAWQQPTISWGKLPPLCALATPSSRLWLKSLIERWRKVSDRSWSFRSTSWPPGWTKPSSSGCRR